MLDDSLQGCIIHSETTQSTNTCIQKYACILQASLLYLLSRLKELERRPYQPKPSIRQPPIHELKPLHSHLRYTYLDDNSKLPIIISSTLIDLEVDKLLRVLRDNKLLYYKLLPT